MAKSLHLMQTKYANPHGLPNRSNVSSAHDVCRIARHAQKMPIIREIVSKQTYCPNIISTSFLPCYYKWENTNKSLGMGFSGMKTGITSTAGPCLCATYNYHDKTTFIITVLGCRNVDIRWQEVQKLAQWASTIIETDCSD